MDSPGAGSGGGGGGVGVSALPTIPDIDSDGKVIVEQQRSQVREQLAADEAEDGEAKKSGYDTM